MVPSKAAKLVSKNGVLIANAAGKAAINALFNLQDRSFVDTPGGMVLMIIGIHSCDNDLTVNALKGKQLTIRAAGTDEAQSLVPPIQMTLEQAMEFIDDDELRKSLQKAFACARSY